MSESPTPTVSQVRDWQLEQLEQQGGFWNQQASKFQTELDVAYNDIGNSADYLVGKFGNGLRDKSVTVRDTGYRTIGALQAAGTAISNGLEPLRFAQKTVTTLLTAITSGGFLWGEDGTVTLSLAQTANALSGDADSAAIKLAALERQADEYTRALQAGLSGAGAAAQSVVQGIDTAFAELPNAGAAPSVDGNTGADLGAEVAKEGPVSPEAMTRIEQALDQVNLSGDDQATLASGATVVVPASTLEFTQRLLETAGPEGFAELSEQLRAQGPEGEARAQALGNAVMLLSNEQVVGVGADGGQTPGGYDRLPGDVQQMISTRVSLSGSAPDDTASQYPDMGLPGIANQGAFLSQQGRFLDAIAQSDPGYQPGTKLSTELHRQGLHLAWLESHNVQMGPDSGVPLDDSLTNAIEIASRNHEGTTAILTGEGGPEILGDGYHPDTAMLSLLQRESSDPNSPLLGAMTDWIPQDAHVTVPPEHPDYQAQVDQATHAGRAARGLADIISTTDSADGTNNFDVLLSGKNPDDLGTLNSAGISPEAAKEVAEALQPFVGKLVGMPDDLSGTLGFGNDFGPREVVRTLSVLSTDPGASQIINGAALAESQRMDKVFVTPGMPGAGDPDIGRYANRMEWAVNEALKNEYSERSDEARDAAAEKTAQWNAAYTAAQIAASGFGPGGVAAATAAEPFKLGVFPFDPEQVDPHDPLKYNLRPDQVGPHDPLTVNGNDFSATEFGDPAHRQYNALLELTNQGRIDINDVPPEYKDASGQRFKNYTDYTADIKGQPQGDRTPSADRVNALLTGAGIDTTKFDAYGQRADDGEDSALENQIKPLDGKKTVNDVLAGLAEPIDPKNTWPK
ncbi:Uncharacterised protein [Nocardia otitidiscaviarum]|uniref:TPR repeat domain-containing protein n=1 Tax=Nocardia otitidiscaviarum TaxID=1823 RepID=A0A378Y8R4_9NOCA|nr:hypothetical protein [Nocardia otitidiscaviarum]SUA72749.1 Uncharacterised protein [Nocardia otitidiscaviarum]